MLYGRACEATMKQAAAPAVYAYWMTFLFVVAFCGICARPASAQPCSALKAADSGPTGYQQRTDPQRCEGMYRQDHAGEGDLEFLSLVRGAINYDLSRDMVRTITVPDVRGVHASAVSVRVANITDASPNSPHYRLDAQIPSAQSIDWILTAVVAPEHLQSGGMGVLGCIGGCDDYKPIYVPVWVSNKAQSGRTGDNAVATFRFGNDLQNVRWRLYPGMQCTGQSGGSTGPVSTESDPNGVDPNDIIPADELIHIKISTFPAPRCLRIVGNLASTTDKVEEDIRLFVP